MEFRYSVKREICIKQIISVLRELEYTANWLYNESNENYHKLLAESFG